MSVAVKEYIQEDGSNPYKKWFDELNVRAAAKIATARAKLETGNTSPVSWMGSFGEYRLD